MKSLAVAVPLAPGAADQLREFGREVEGPGRDEHTESRRSLGLTKELCWIQATPQGDMFILYLEGENPVEANKEFAGSQTPYNRRFKDGIEPIFASSGVDFSQPIPPITEQLLDWEAEGRAEAASRLHPMVVVGPIQPGKTDALRAGTSSAMEERLSGHEASRKKLGIYAERVWVEHTPQGDLLLAYFEAEDPQAVFAGVGISQDPHDVWFRQLNMDVLGLDLTQPPPGPPPELVLDWQDR